MIIQKITTGFVVQQFDTEKHTFIAQEFVAGDECEYEDKEGNSVSPDAVVDSNGKEAYLPYEMVQPTVQSAGDQK